MVLYDVLWIFSMMVYGEFYPVLWLHGIYELYLYNHQQIAILRDSNHDRWCFMWFNRGNWRIMGG